MIFNNEKLRDVWRIGERRQLQTGGFFLIGALAGL